MRGRSFKDKYPLPSVVQLFVIELAVSKMSDLSSYHCKLKFSHFFFSFHYEMSSYIPLSVMLCASRVYLKVRAFSVCIHWWLKVLCLKEGG